MPNPVLSLLLGVLAWPASAAPQPARAFYHPGVAAIAFAPDARTLASAGSEANGTAGDIRIWDVPSGKRLHLYPGSTGVNCLAYSPDGKHRASGDDNGAVRVCDADTGKLEYTLTTPSAAIFSISWSPNGERLAVATGYTDPSPFSLGVWSARTHRALWTTGMGDAGVFVVRFSRDGRKLACCGGEEEGDGVVWIWDSISGRRLHSMDTVGWEYGLSFAPDGKTLACARGLPEGEPAKLFRAGVDLWNVATGRLRRSITRQVPFDSVTYSPDGKLIAAGTEDAQIRIYSAATGKLLRVLTDQGGRVTSVAFSPDGSLLASAAGNYVRVRPVHAR